MSARRSALPDPDTTAPASFADATKVVGWGLVFWAGVQVAAAAFARNAIAMVAVQAAVAEWGAGRMAIAWTDPLATIRTPRAIVRRAARGASLGLSASVLACAAVLVTSRATLAPGAPVAGLLAVGLVAAALQAVRDELLLRGIVVRATRGLLPVWATLVACGGVAAAARFGVDRSATIEIAFEALRGIALGAVWLRDRGAWMAWGANAAWTWSTGSMLQGGLFDVRFVTAPDANPSVLVVTAVAALAASFWAIRRPGPGTPSA